MIVRAGTPGDVADALRIWRGAVDATHAFLAPADRAAIDTMVATQFLPNAALWVAEDDGAVLGWLAMDGDTIDALFVDPAVHGRGVGTALLAKALALCPGARVDANEQASNALPFYQARGFVVTGRSETDGQGRPYPLVHLAHRAGGPDAA